MSLAQPARIVAMRDDGAGIVELGGERQTVNLALIDNPKVGDHILVETGYAVRRLCPIAATWALGLMECAGQAVRIVSTH